MLTLAEISLEMGIPKSYISRRWKEYGWHPVGKVGGALAFSLLAIAEWKLAKSLATGITDIYWLPWGWPQVLKVLGLNDSSRRKAPPMPIYLTRPDTGKGRDPKFFHPLEMKTYATTYGYPYHFLLGFEGEARESWNEQICLWESLGEKGPQDVLASADPPVGREDTNKKVGQSDCFYR